MAIYGKLHSVADFIGRVVPKRGHGKFGELFVHSVITALKKMDAVQEKNAWLSVNFYAADGIWTFYKGQLALLLLPAQNHLRLLIFRDSTNQASKEIAKSIRQSATNGDHFKKTLHAERWWQWQLGPSELELFCGFLEGLEVDNVTTRLSGEYHPRNFPAPARHAAEEIFHREGSWCPGVGRKRHKLNLKGGVDKIEFDHILAHAKGGSNTEFNVRVLCSECNRKKGASNR